MFSCVKYFAPEDYSINCAFVTTDKFLTANVSKKWGYLITSVHPNNDKF